MSTKNNLPGMEPVSPDASPLERFTNFHTTLRATPRCDLVPPPGTRLAAPAADGGGGGRPGCDGEGWDDGDGGGDKRRTVWAVG